MANTDDGFTEEETAFMQEDAWFLSKNRISGKVARLLESLAVPYREELTARTGLPSPVLQSAPRLSKGENFRGLPWMIFDYPRVFGKPDVFAFRTFFWWGRYFCCYWHLAGAYLSRYRSAVLRNLPALHGKDFRIAVGSDPWVHAVDDVHYRPVESFNTGGPATGMPFFKLARTLDIARWPGLESFGVETLRCCLDLLR